MGGDLELAARASNGRRLTPWIALLRARAGDGDVDDAGDPSPDRRLAMYQALLRADRGELVDANRLRARLGTPDPTLLAPLDAQLFLGRGLPDQALSALGGRGDRRALVLRGLALLDLRRAADAEAELAVARARGAGDDVVALHALAQVLARLGDAPGAAGKLRREEAQHALATLELLAAAARGGLVAYALGEAQLGLGNDEAASESFAAVAAAGPWGFRAATRRAELELAAFDRTRDPRRLVEADAAARAAQEHAPDYLPARAVVGRLLVHSGQPEGGLAAFAPVVAAGRDGPLDDLALAEAYLAVGDREHAREAVRKAAHKGAPARPLRATAERVDRSLLGELGR
jgi:tetratricopeptide (TPR) repeat protein